MEDSFITEETGFITLSLGAKGSGKSHLLLSCVRRWLAEGKYATFHLVLPNFASEEHGSYDFLKQHKERVYVYPRYVDLVAERVIRVQESKKRAGAVFFAIDDATAQIDIFGSAPLCRIATESRHLGVHLWVLAHAAKRVFTPVWRANIDHLFTGRITNTVVLKTLWEEYYSLVPGLERYKDFMRMYGEVVLAKQYGCLYLNVRSGKFEPVEGWAVLAAAKNGRRKVGEGDEGRGEGEDARRGGAKARAAPPDNKDEAADGRKDPGSRPKGTSQGGKGAARHYALAHW
jgi:hypothetical protein